MSRGAPLLGSWPDVNYPDGSLSTDVQLPIWNSFITARNEVGARLYFHRRVWFCSRGVSAPRVSAPGGLLRGVSGSVCSRGVCSWGCLVRGVSGPGGVWSGGCLVLGQNTQGGNWGGLGPGPQPRGKLKGIRSRPTPKGETEGDQIQAHTQGGNWGGSDPGPHPGGKLRGIRSRSTPKGGIQGDQDYDQPPPTTTDAGGMHPTGMHSCFQHISDPEFIASHGYLFRLAHIDLLVFLSKYKYIYRWFLVNIQHSYMYIGRTWNHGEFSFLGNFWKLKNHQVEQKLQIFGKKIYCPIFDMGKLMFPRKIPGEIFHNPFLPKKWKFAVVPSTSIVFQSQNVTKCCFKISLFHASVESIVVEMYANDSL